MIKTLQTILLMSLYSISSVAIADSIKGRIQYISQAEPEQGSFTEHSEKSLGDTPALQPVESEVEVVEDHKNEDGEEEGQLMVQELC